MDEVPTTRLLAGRYRLLRRAGHGGMSEVHVARDELLGRDVAIKLVTADLIDAGGVERLEREARAVAGLQHPNVVTVHDTLREGDDAAIVMELVDGGTLADRLRADAPLPWREAVGMALHVARGLAAAHERGLVHRDVKPANVLLGTDGTVKVADFGIAGAMAASTQTATIRGSIPYLAPEQARGEHPDPRTDVYALGCVLHEMLTGHPPFTGDTGAAVIGQHLHRDPEPPSRRVPGLSRQLDAVVLRMLATEPDERHPDMQAVITDLTSVLEGHAVTAPLLADTVVMAPGPRSRRPLLLGLAGAVALVVLWVAWRALVPGAAGPDEAPVAADTTAPTEAADSTTPPPGTEPAAPGPTNAVTDQQEDPPGRPETVADAATAFRELLATGRSEGGVSAKAVEELDKLVTEIVQKANEGDNKGVQDKAKDLGTKLDEYVEKGEITSTELADRLGDAAQDFRRLA